MENISVSVLVHFIISNQQKRFYFLCSLEGNTLMRDDGLHRNREVRRCSSSSIKVICHNQLFIYRSLGCVDLIRAMAVAVAPEGPTELAVLVQVCLCSLTTPPGSREMFSKQVRCLKRHNLAHWVCGTPATPHLLLSQDKSNEQHKRAAVPSIHRVLLYIHGIFHCKC